jgi:hypothetical protein
LSRNRAAQIGSSQGTKIPKNPCKILSGKWKWKIVPPTDGDPVKKEFEGKHYHWCPGQKFWTMHQPSDCTLLHSEKRLPATSPKKKPTPVKKLTFAEAALAATEAEDQEPREAKSDNEA